MQSVESLKEKFQSILSSCASWKSLVPSQFASHVSAFVGWGVRDGQYKIERAHQESFASTSINPSSIMAHAEDREYLPIKPIPAKGTLLVKNNGASISLPIYSEFLADDEIFLVTTQPVTIPSNLAIEVPVEQKRKVTYDFEIKNFQPFFEALLPVDDTAKISSLSVQVDEKDGIGFRLWKKARLLTNTTGTSLAYDEFYSHTDQFGVRFGNGTFGKVPAAGSQLVVTAWNTLGDVFLAEGQEVSPSYELLDASGQPADVEVTISKAIINGSAAEGIESIKKNLHYWQTYNDNMVWDDDYSFFIKRKVPTLNFIKVWGEEEMEKQAGGHNVSFINKIFFAVHAPKEENLGDRCVDEFKRVNKLNKKFQSIPVAHKTFSLRITGKILPDAIKETVEEAIKKGLIAAYGRDSYERRDEVFLNEIFKVIQDTGYFKKSTGASFDVEPVGGFKAVQLEDMVSIDIEATSIDLSYI